MTTEQIFAAFALLAFAAVLIMAFVQQRTISALTAAVKDAGNNKPFLDTIEKVAKEVVPASLVASINSGATFLEAFTNDEQDALIEAFRAILNKATDGLPNGDSFPQG